MCESEPAGSQGYCERGNIGRPLRDANGGENNGTLTVSIPCEVAEAEEVEQGNKVAVGLDTETGELRYVPVEEFEGW